MSGVKGKSGRKPKPDIDPMTGLELPTGFSPPTKNAAVVDASLDRLSNLQKEIAAVLPDESDEVTALLAWAASRFDLLAAVREAISLSRKGPKPHIDCQWLLIDCAQIYERVHGEPTEQVLSSLVKVSNSDTQVDWGHPVIRWAGAVLKVAASEDEISRRQIAGAIKRYAENTH